MKTKNFCNSNEFYETLKEGDIVNVNKTLIFEQYRFICIKKYKSNASVSMKGFLFDKNLLIRFKKNIIWSYADNSSLFRFEIIC